MQLKPTTTTAVGSLLVMVVIVLQIGWIMREKSCFQEANQHQPTSVEHNESSIWKGYVVSLNTDRWNHMEQLLPQCGVKPIRVVPLSPNARIVLLDGGRASELVSSKYSHRDAMLRIAYDSSLPDDGWGLIFEDDVALQHQIAPTMVEPLLKYATHLSQEDGFFYLGVCRTTPCGSEIFEFQTVQMCRCTGRCAHAYAVAKWRAKWLFDELVLNIGQLKGGSDALDVLFERGLGIPNPILVGSNIHEDGTPSEHVGIFYQDRKKYPSQLNYS